MAPSGQWQENRLYSTVWAYSPQKAREIQAQVLQAGGFRRVAAGAPRADDRELLEGMARIRCPTLIVYGYQDYEPITQAYTLRERIGGAEIALLNECGHFPWIDQPEAFYRLLQTFIGGRPPPAEPDPISPLRSRTGGRA